MPFDPPQYLPHPQFHPSHASLPKPSRQLIGHSEEVLDFLLEDNSPWLVQSIPPVELEKPPIHSRVPVHLQTTRHTHNLTT